MRILVPTLTRPHLGGAHTLLATTGRGLRRRGHEVTFVSLFGVGAEPPLARAAVKRSDRFLSGAGGDRPRDTRTIALYVAARAALAVRIAWVLARRRHDVALTIDAGATRALRMVRGLFPLAVVFDVAGRLVLDLEGQGKIARGGRASRWFLAEERASYRQASLVLAYPRSFALDLQEVALGSPIVTTSTAVVDIDRITRVTDPAARSRARASFGVPEGGAVLLVPSRLVARKGVVEAVAILAAMQRPDARLVLAGEGPEESAVRAAAADLGVADRVHVLGGVMPERMSDCYAMADVVLLPAVPALGYEEPQGLTTFEALAAGRPVVASALGGIPEVIRDGETGLLSPPGDARAFAALLERVLGDATLAASLVAGGAAELERRLAADAHFALIEELLLAVSGPGAGGEDRRQALLRELAPAPSC